MTNKRTSKSEETNFKSDDEELVTAIESILWRNDRKKKSQSSQIQPSSTSNKETEYEGCQKLDINSSSLSGALNTESKEKDCNSFR